MLKRNKKIKDFTETLSKNKFELSYPEKLYNKFVKDIKLFKETDNSNSVNFQTEIKENAITFKASYLKDRLKLPFNSYYHDHNCIVANSGIFNKKEFNKELYIKINPNREMAIIAPSEMPYQVEETYIINLNNVSSLEVTLHFNKELDKDYLNEMYNSMFNRSNESKLEYIAKSSYIYPAKFSNSFKVDIRLIGENIDFSFNTTARNLISNNRYSGVFSSEALLKDLIRQNLYKKTEEGMITPFMGVLFEHANITASELLEHTSRLNFILLGMEEE